MDRPLPTSVDATTAAAKGDLSPHEQRIVELALQAATAAAQVRAEEIIVRTRNVVSTEIDRAFTAYTSITMGRRVAMAVAGLAAFGVGFLVRGWVRPEMEDEPESNGVHHE